MAFSERDALELNSALRHDAQLFAPQLSHLAFERGLAVTNKDDGSKKPIPVTGTPIIISEEELKRRQRLAAMLSSAGLKMASAVLGGFRRELVYEGLSPLEQTLADATFKSLTTLVTTRVDFFVGATVQALELNATIPAMQGYSDIAANTFLEAVGKAWGAPDDVIAGWQGRNGSNALALYRALLRGYAQVRPGQVPARIALLCRRNDAQITEQQYLRDRFRDYGTEADIVHPDELSGDTAIVANGKTYDLIYRHLFVRRLEEPGMAGAEFVKALLAEPNGTRAVVLNPPASQVEAKVLFALLSEALEDQAIVRAAQLNEAEVDAVHSSVPWTRVFRGGTVVDEVKANPDRYVIKRSWDYGGRAVFVGKTRAEPSFVERVKAAYGQALSWEQLCDRASTDATGGGFVAQQLVETSPETHLLCGPEKHELVDLYVDFSTYASVGVGAQPAWGGVCRGSLSPIVNIVGGGGVLPLLTQDVANSLLMAYRAWVK